MCSVGASRGFRQGGPSSPPHSRFGLNICQMMEENVWRPTELIILFLFSLVVYAVTETIKVPLFLIF